jgi:hypothetical protein
MLAIMVHYPNPKYIKKTHVHGKSPYKFSALDKRADQVATIATSLSKGAAIIVWRAIVVAARQ